MKRKRQGAKGQEGRWRCTIADVKKAHWMLYTDPQKFERSERLKWIVATFEQLLAESEQREHSDEGEMPAASSVPRAS